MNIGELPIEQWIKKKEICSILNITDERRWRLYVSEHNKAWIQGKEAYFIAHSNNGYCITQNRITIVRSVEDNRRRAMDQLYKVSQVYKKLNLDGQYEFLFEENHIAELIGKKGITRNEFIKRVNEAGGDIDKYTLSKMINNKVKATQEQVTIFASVLGFKPFEFYSIKKYGQ